MANINEEARIPVYINDEQAKSALKNLQNEADKWRKKMFEAMEGGDLKGMKDAEREMKKAQKAMGDIKREAFDVNKVLQNISNASLKDLKAALRAVDREMEGLNRSSKQYQALMGKKTAIRTELSAINGVIREQPGFFNKAADATNKYLGIIAAAGAAFTGVVLGFKQLVKSFNDYEERVDNLSALTGLAGESLDWLSQKAKDLSTSTLEGGIRVKQGAQEIIDAFTKTGSARPELLKNKEALSAVTEEAIILANASKTELQPAIEALTMVMNQYNVPASEARRIINSLAAGSKAGAGEIPYLTQAFEKAGTVAADAGISIETLVATIETLAPRITQPEIAGRSLKGVILDLQNGADDTNPAIVGLSTALENLGKQNLSVTDLTKRFGVENITTAKILIDNVGELKKYEAAVTGTNVAIEQASINTDNNNAKLAQAKNRIDKISIALGEKLSPAMTVATGWYGKSLAVLSVLVDVITKYSGIIITSTVAIVSYTVAVKLLTFWETRNNEQKGIGLILTKAQALANAVLRAGTLLLSAAQALLTGNITRATAAMRLFNTTTKFSPIGLIITLLATAAAAFIAFGDDIAETTKEQRKFNDELERSSELMGQSKSLDERAKVMNTMNKRQLDELKGSIASQITAEEDFHSKLLQSAKKAVDEDVKLQEIRNEQKKQGLSAFQKQMLDQQAEFRKRDIVRDLQDQDDASKARLSRLKKHQGEAVKLAEKFPKTDQVTPTTPGDADVASKALDLAHASEILSIKQYYADKENLDKESKARLLASELAYLQTKAQLETNQLAKVNLQAQIIDKQREYTAALKEAVPEMMLNVEGIAKLNKQLLEEAKLLGFAAKKQAEGAADQEEYTAKQVQQAETVKMIGDVMTDYVSGALNGSMDEFQSFGDTLILMSLQMLKMMVPIWSAQILGLSLASPESVATWGAAGMAKFALITGLMYAGISAVEGVVKGGINKKREAAGGSYYDGGYTGSGGKYQPAGIVHAGEWVMPKNGVDNPGIRPFIDLMEIARRNGSLARLDLRPVVQAMASGKGYSVGGSTGSSSGSSSSSSPVIMPGNSSGISNEQLVKLNAILDRLDSKDFSIAIETYERKRKGWESLTSGGLK